MNSNDRRRPQQGVLLRAALALARRGWHVFPCITGGKRPALPDDWKAIATTDPERVWRWWSVRRWNIGISCEPSGLIVIDLDVPRHLKRGKKVEDGLVTGADELARICREENVPYPEDTFRVGTPSGGEHLYFDAGGLDLRNSAGRLAPLIDIRAAGGYVVGPGSQTGQGDYRVLQGETVLPFPAWLARRLTRSPGRELAASADGVGAIDANCSDGPVAALNYAERRVATARKGTRNDTLNRAAYYMGQLVGGRRLDAGAVVPTLLRAALASGLTEREALRTIRSGMSAGESQPRRYLHPRYASW